MNLYKRDFLILSKKEIQLLDRINKKFSKGFLSAEAFLKVPHEYYQLTSRFPNNYLDIDDLKDKEYLKLSIKNFKKLLTKAVSNERDALNFINSNKSYFFIGSILDNYDFGHHGAFLFPEFRLGNEHIVDYLLIGKNSGGYEFVFIELEAIHQNITTKDGSIGNAINKGLKQIDDWSNWLQANFSSLRRTFKQIKNQKEELPEEFYEYDSSRIHFVVVAGRRNDFNKRTYRIRRTKRKENNILILHYDNLIDYVSSKLKVEYANY